MLASEALAQALLEEGVRHVFGVPGAQPLGVLDALERLGRPRGMRFVCTRHEQAAAHMADTESRLSGRVGVCLGTVGPGAANLVPGVYEAFANGVPMLVLTAQNQTWRSYPDEGSTQGCDHLALFGGITRWRAVVNRPERVGSLVREAFRQAVAGRPGPVLLDLPVDVMAAEVPAEACASIAPERYRAVRPQGADPELVAASADLVAASRRPLLHLGGGALRARAPGAFVALAERLGCPVTTSPSGRGAFPETHELWLPAASPAAIAAQNDADLVLLLGTRLGAFDFFGRPPLWGDAKEQGTIQVDATLEAVGRHRELDLAVRADAGRFAAQLLEAVEARGVATRPASALAEINSLRDDREAELAALGEGGAEGVHPMFLARAVRAAFPPRSVFVVDGGNTAVFAHHALRVDPPGAYLGAGNSGMGGGGLPKAIAAKLVAPDMPVVALCGDGFFSMNMQELETATRMGALVVVVVANDSAFGMIRAGQKAACGGRYVGVDFGDVRYDQMATAAGWHGERVRRPGELAAALDRARGAGRPALLDVIVDREANLSPPDLDTLVAIWLEGVSPCGEAP